MNIIYWSKRIIGYPLRKSIRCYNERKLLKAISNKKKPTVFLFGSPGHSNMGDQAQTYCILKWLDSNYKGYNQFVFTLSTATDKVLNSIRKNISVDDLIVFHSGYHLTDLYDEKDVYCKVAKMFPDFKIFIFPQTINFIRDKKDEEYVSKTLNEHGRITLCCRDELSYENAKKIFSNCKLLLYPDVVTSLIGTLKFNNQRNGILFCMRNDVEALYSSHDIDQLRNKFVGVETKMTDTTINVSYSVIKKERERILLSMFNEFSKYKLVITDRYHGTIFSLIAGTPVIVLSSTDHKLSSGVKWFPESFNDYVKYVPNLDEAYQVALKMLSNDATLAPLTAYFEDNYYSILKSKM